MLRTQHAVDLRRTPVNFVPLLLVAPVVVPVHATENERAALELSAPGGAYTAAAVHVESSASVDTSTMNPVQHVQVIDRDRDRPVALSTVTRDATDNQQVVPQSSSEPAELTDRFVEEQVLEATRRLRAELYENELAHQRDRQKCRQGLKTTYGLNSRFSTLPCLQLHEGMSLATATHFLSSL